MSKLACKLFEERENTTENYQPLLCALFGQGEYNTKHPDITPLVSDALEELGESNPFGLLQMYFIEEYFLHGKSKEAIGQEIAKNMELLLADLEYTAIRYLRHPDRSKALAKCTKMEA